MSQPNKMPAPVATSSHARDDGMLHRNDSDRAKSTDQVLITRVGLHFPAKLTFDRWERAGRQIVGIINSSAWCLGDWVAYGEKEYAGRYRQAIEAVGLDYQTLRNYVWVARRFEPSRRRDGLSFQHHAEVASLPPTEQDEWLDRAEEGGWPRNQLRRNMRESRSSPPALESGEALLPRIDIGSDRVKYWRQAADKTGETLESWVVVSLDFVASQVLERPVAGLDGGRTTANQ